MRLSTAFHSTAAAIALTLAALCLSPAPVKAGYVQIKLVSDICRLATVSNPQPAQTRLNAANGSQRRIDFFNTPFARIMPPGTFVAPADVAALEYVTFTVPDATGKAYVLEFF
jgi:hypothetical protein